MNRLLLFSFFILASLQSYSQTGYLFVKKGARKKAVYGEGSNIYLRLHDKTLRYGMITRLVNDTIYVNGTPVPCRDVQDVLLSDKNKPTFHLDPKQVLLITGGVALVTAGLTLSKQAKFSSALTAGLVIGYGPLALGWLRSKISLKRRRYVIGKKFRLQVLDFYLPRQKAF